ncbi:MAG TPA: sigma-70 family RNA polymerase sigma factor [Gaiellaceae bacterium]|jgi:RNA polymerase sigma-B factor
MRRTIESCSDRRTERDRLIEDHLPLVQSLARRQRGCDEPLDDLVQVGALALVRAAERYDANRGIPFAAYAIPTVNGEIRRYLRDRGRTVRVPRREQETGARLRRTGLAAAMELGREPSLGELARAAGVDEKAASRALQAALPVVSLTALSERPSLAAEEELDRCEDRTDIDGAARDLSARERALLGLRFGADLSQGEIARILHISQSQASRLISAALDKLRAGLGDDGSGRQAA